jgi:AmmeMemoRadiSam system protein B
MWNHLTGTGPRTVLAETPRGVILPHHSIEGLRVGGFYKALAERMQPRTVYVISPNHFEAGTAAVVTGEDLDYATVYGTLEVDKGKVESFVSSGLAERLDSAFVIEHGVFFHSPYIKKFFPQAKIVPLLIRWGAPRPVLDAVVAQILGQLEAGDLLVGSVDFSHYNFRATAEFHDRSSYATIMNFDYDNLFDREMDSPGSVYVVERVMTSLGYGHAERIWQTNTDDLAFEPQDNATSHQYFTFTPGTPDPRESFTLLVTGRSQVQEVRTSWQWDRDYHPERDKGPTGFLRDVRGAEDRFFMGSDLYLLDPPLDPQVKFFERNGARVSLFRFGPGAALQDQLSQVRNAAGSWPVVLYRFADGADVEKRRAVGRGFIEAGARVFVAQGPPEIAPDVETWKSGVMALSLGSFLPGPDHPDGKGLVLQVELTPEQTWHQEIVVDIKGGYPSVVR